MPPKFIPLVERLEILERELRSTKLELQKLKLRVAVALKEKIPERKPMSKDKAIRMQFRNKLLRSK